MHRGEVARKVFHQRWELPVGSRNDDKDLKSQRRESEPRKIEGEFLGYENNSSRFTEERLLWLDFRSVTER